jgi:hypothetical protein
MRIERKNADANGIISYGQGFGLCLVPLDKGAKFPLQLEFSGSGRQEVLEEERPIYSAFTSVKVTDAAPESEWLAYLTETVAEAIGPLNRAVPMRRLNPEAEIAGVLAAGTYYLDANGALTTTATNREWYDVRGLRNVLLAVQAPNLVINSGAPTLAVYLDLVADLDLTLETSVHEPVPAGSVNDMMAGGGGLAWVQVGPDLAAEVGTNKQTATYRFPYASPRIVVAGGSIDTDAGLFVEVRGSN